MPRARGNYGCAGCFASTKPRVSSYFAHTYTYTYEYRKIGTYTFSVASSIRSRARMLFRGCGSKSARPPFAVRSVGDQGNLITNIPRRRSGPAEVESREIAARRQDYAVDVKRKGAGSSIVAFLSLSYLLEGRPFVRFLSRLRGPAVTS